MHELKHNYRYLIGPALAVVAVGMVSIIMGVVINSEYQHVKKTKTHLLGIMTKYFIPRT